MSQSFLWLGKGLCGLWSPFKQCGRDPGNLNHIKSRQALPSGTRSILLVSSHNKPESSYIQHPIYDGHLRARTFHHLGVFSEAPLDIDSYCVIYECVKFRSQPPRRIISECRDDCSFLTPSFGLTLVIHGISSPQQYRNQKISHSPKSLPWCWSNISIYYDARQLFLLHWWCLCIQLFWHRLLIFSFAANL